MQKSEESLIKQEKIAYMEEQLASTILEFEKIVKEKRLAQALATETSALSKKTKAAQDAAAKVTAPAIDRAQAAGDRTAAQAAHANALKTREEHLAAEKDSKAAAEKVSELNARILVIKNKLFEDLLGLTPANQASEKSSPNLPDSLYQRFFSLWVPTKETEPTSTEKNLENLKKISRDKFNTKEALREAVYEVSEVKKRMRLAQAGGSTENLEKICNFVVKILIIESEFSKEQIFNSVQSEEDKIKKTATLAADAKQAALQEAQALVTTAKAVEAGSKTKTEGEANENIRKVSEAIGSRDTLQDQLAKIEDEKEKEVQKTQAIVSILVESDPYFLLLQERSNASHCLRKFFEKIQEKLSPIPFMGEYIEKASRAINSLESKDALEKLTRILEEILEKDFTLLINNEEKSQETLAVIGKTFENPVKVDRDVEGVFFLLRILDFLKWIWRNLFCLTGPSGAETPVSASQGESSVSTARDESVDEIFRTIVSDLDEILKILAPKEVGHADGNDMKIDAKGGGYRSS